MSKEKFSFDLLKVDCSARLGQINTHRGKIDTPAFMPVGTQGTVKSIFIDDAINENSGVKRKQQIPNNEKRILFVYKLIKNPSKLAQNNKPNIFTNFGIIIVLYT